MNLKILNTIIPMASLLIFFIWGWIEGNYQHSWIIFMVGGMAMGVLSAISKNREKESDGKNKDDRK